MCFEWRIFFIWVTRFLSFCSLSIPHPWPCHTPGPATLLALPHPWPLHHSCQFQTWINFSPHDSDIIQQFVFSGFTYISMVPPTWDKHCFWLLAWLHQCNIHSCGVIQFPGSKQWYGSLNNLSHACSVGVLRVYLNFCVSFIIYCMWTVVLHLLVFINL
jgi:hypothetical protein